MKTLIVFYSLEGNTKLIAQFLEKLLKENESEVEVYQLRPEKEIPQKGFFRYILGGGETIFGKCPALLNEPVDLKQYERVIIGTPVWAGGYASPLNTFFHDYEIKDKEVALFACCKGKSPLGCLEKMKAVLSGNRLLGCRGFQEPVQWPLGTVQDVVAKWLKEMGLL